MAYKVISPFRDKYNKDKVYRVGEPFFSDEKERIQDLLDRKLIEGVSNDDTPTFNYESLTKDELMALLEEKGIEFNKRQTKAELIQLLGGE